VRPTIYVITAYRFNHSSENPIAQPLDPRFLCSNRNFVYYLIDQQVPAELRGKQVLFEQEIDPLLAEAGRRYLAEWAFLLAEVKHAFCSYPFFMISSRFYQKNNWLVKDLSAQWDELFSYFDHYGWGYLPSYDRGLRWIDLSWKHHVEKEAWRYRFYPFTAHTYALIEQLFNVKIPEDYSHTSDFFCNYIGFQSRQHLLNYVRFYDPLFSFLFDTQFLPRQDLSLYVRTTGGFRNEKPTTFLLELLSHLYFFKTRQPFFALHYDGFYEVREHETRIRRLGGKRRPLPLYLRHYLQWKWLKMNTEGPLAPLRASLREWRQ
jgi:hypothetical protein